MKKVEFGCSYFGCKYIEHFKQDLKILRDTGFRKILLTFSETDYFFYYKTLSQMIDIAKNFGFKVYIDPWGVLAIFGGESFSKWLIDYPDIWQTLNTGEKIGAACINHPKTKELLIDWLRLAIDTAADVIFWDEPHFYFKDFQNPTGIWGCVCPICNQQFRKKFGYDIPRAVNNDLIQFRSESISDLLKDVCELTYQARKKNNICILPTEDTMLGGFSDWSNLKKIKNIDILSTDPYWQRKNREVKEYVGYYTDKIITVSKELNTAREIWVQAYKIIAGREQEIAQAVELLLSKNIESIMFWSYKAGYPMSALESDDVQTTWQVICELVKKYG